MKHSIYSDKAYRQNVERLTAAYEALKREALQKMSPAEIGMLYAEKSVDARIAANICRTHPGELSTLRKERADAAVKDIGDFIRESQRDKDRDLER